jgi:predicted acyltransferase
MTPTTPTAPSQRLIPDQPGHSAGASNIGRSRVLSLDALRGFDMFWIMGGEEIFHTLAKNTGSPFWTAISDQFEHPAWNGFHFYDLIFPLFLFIAGVATPYSVGRELEKGTPRKKLLLRVIRRGLILVLLGIMYNNGLKIHPLSEIRFCSVLGRIGLAYMFANIIYLYTKQLGQIIWFASLLIGYWLLLSLTSAPGHPRGDLTMEGNFASWVDRTILPGRLYLGIHDPEGLMSTIPAIGTGLLGILTGNFLKNSSFSPSAKAARMAVAGVISLLLALAWNTIFPINKNLWTSSFVLNVGGISLLLLACFYYIIDVRGYRKWAFFFSVIGMNSILIYLSPHFINWHYMTDGFFYWVGQLIPTPWNALAMVFCFLAVKWAFMYFLYRKKIFLRV